jgi:hypothetical protein
MLYDSQVYLEKWKKKPRILKVELNGGIGNQLFMLFAALDISSLKSSQLKIYSPRTSKGFQIHGSSLESFDFVPELEVEAREFKRILRHRAYAFLYRKFRSLSFPLILFSSYYESPEIGYDKFIKYINGHGEIKGYFQTYRHFENYIAKCPSFNLKVSNPSNEFLELDEKLASKFVTVIHVRLGDYFLHQNSIGILSAEYFRSALAKLNIEGSEILVCSDDISEATAMLADFLPANTLWIGSDKLNAEESLALMRRGNQFVISNSSFSYWGALLARDPITVIAPSKWFKGENDPVDLIPPQWEIQRSIWR